METSFKSELSSLSRTELKGLFSVRCEILDYCSSEEQASLITGFLHNKTLEVEKKRPDLGVITKFSLKHGFEQENQREYVDVLMLSSKGDIVGQYRLHYRDGGLSPYTAEETALREMIPFSTPGTVMTDISGERMKILLNNSKAILRNEVKVLAISIIDCINSSIENNSNNFTLQICKKKVKLSCNLDHGEAFCVDIPLSWFVVSKSVYNTVNEEASENTH